MVNFGGFGFVVGGLDEYSIRKEVEKYSFIDGQWSRQQDLPFPITGHSSVTFRGAIYIFGK